MGSGMRYGQGDRLGSGLIAGAIIPEQCDLRTELTECTDGGTVQLGRGGHDARELYYISRRALKQSNKRWKTFCLFLQ